MCIHIPNTVSCQTEKINFYGYAERPSRSLLTTKGTKNRKRECQLIHHALCALRGEIAIGQILLELFI
jgi:hypothetical protein